MKKILIVRRDNIGDLICTTPLIRALRRKFPDAWLGALVNSYNAGVLARNTALDAVFSYQKAKHRSPGQSVAAIYWARLKLILRLRAMKLDYVILAAPGFQRSAYRFAKFVQPRHIAGYADPAQDIDLALPPAPLTGVHQVERVFRLGRLFGIDGTPPPLELVADPLAAEEIAALLSRHPAPRIGLHISAREANRRWPAESFAQLARQLLQRYDCTIVLTWAPGDQANPLFPGDSAAAYRIIGALDDPRVVPLPTPTLVSLMAGIAACDYLICSDGGPVHLAAGFGKPVLCFFGSESPAHWHPWGVPYELLQAPSRKVSDIGVDEALAGFDRLWEKTGTQPSL
ncbi:MAG: glycosyltransferase family 9 protein [Sulfuricellaceae bacterium]|nr:glycosyltransferase family 9 protein [Sulfuricellaceae bacterium]